MQRRDEAAFIAGGGSGSLVRALRHGLHDASFAQTRSFFSVRFGSGSSKLRRSESQTERECRPNFLKASAALDGRAIAFAALRNLPCEFRLHAELIRCGGAAADVRTVKRAGGRLDFIAFLVGEPLLETAEFGRNYSDEFRGDGAGIPDRRAADAGSPADALPAVLPPSLGRDRRAAWDSGWQDEAWKLLSAACAGITPECRKNPLKFPNAVSKFSRFSGVLVRRLCSSCNRP